MGSNVERIRPLLKIFSTILLTFKKSQQKDVQQQQLKAKKEKKEVKQKENDRFTFAFPIRETFDSTKHYLLPYMYDKLLKDVIINR